MQQNKPHLTIMTDKQYEYLCIKQAAKVIGHISNEPYGCNTLYYFAEIKCSVREIFFLMPLKLFLKLYAAVLALFVVWKNYFHSVI